MFLLVEKSAWKWCISLVTLWNMMSVDFSLSKVLTSRLCSWSMILVVGSWVKMSG